VTEVYLDVNHGDEVGSAQHLSALTGEPNTWLLIYSGLANIEQEDWADLFSGGESSSLTVKIILDNVSGELLQFATTASLANIYNGGEGQWAVNSVSLALEENGDLVLTTELWVDVSLGSNVLETYAYYVTAKMLLEAPTISGTIRWQKTLATPSESPLFVITADTQPPATPGELTALVVEATGFEGSLDSADAAYYHVPYTISGPLLGKTLLVEVQPISTAFSDADGGLTAFQISGDTDITLTTTNLHATNVDFELGILPAPK
jgi:hypothetical protein